MDSDRIEGKAKQAEGQAKETEGEVQEAWGKTKDKARDLWEDGKDALGVDDDEPAREEPTRAS